LPNRHLCIVIILLILLPACVSPQHGDISREGSAAADPNSKANEINRVNREPGLTTVQAPRDTTGQPLIHRTFTNGPYILEQVQLPASPTSLPKSSTAPMPRSPCPS